MSASKTTTKPAETCEGSEQSAESFQQTALVIFTDLSRHARKGFDMEKLALDAYRRAQAFLTVGQRIADGELSLEAPPERQRKEIDVTRVRALDDHQGWTPIVDEKTGQPITEKVLTDPDAWAPNLPDDHPINLRFDPEDGVLPKERRKLQNRVFKQQQPIMN